MRKRKIRQRDRPVGKLKPQAVPALASPPFGDPVPLEHEMREAALLQPVAHRQPGLAAADDQGLDTLTRHPRKIGEIGCGG